MPRKKPRVAKPEADLEAKSTASDSPQADVENVDSVIATPARKPRDLRIHLLTIPLLLFLAAQLFFGGRNQSATMDEPNHIARGLVYLRTGDLRLSKEHPPLINLICALPLLFDKSITLPLDDPSWDKGDWYTFAEQLLWKTNDNGPSMVARARLMIIALALLLAVVIYIWAYEFYGTLAALLVLTLAVLDPNLIASGQLATNDLGVTLFSTLSLYTFWRFLRSPANWQRATIAGISLGLALTSKFSAIFLIPVLPLAAVAFWFSADWGKRRPLNLTAILKYSALIGLACALTLWLVYGFRIGPSRTLGFSVPAPAYFDGLTATKIRIERGNSSFLLGDFSTVGWWYYFPAVFLLKTPIPTMLLLLGSLAYTGVKRSWRGALIFLVPAAAYFLICIYSSFNIGYRHLLPALPLLLLFIGQLGTINWRQHRLWVWPIIPMLIWLLVGTVRIFPHYLAYFNELQGGPAAGYTKLVDSNLDWGQDLPGLRKFMEQQNIESVKLSYFGRAFPEAYGVKYEPLPSFPRNSEITQRQINLLQHPPLGVYAISATNLQGVLFPDNYRHIYSWFQARKPDAMIGYSIFIYRVE